MEKEIEKKHSRRKSVIAFLIALLILLACLAISAVNTVRYNGSVHSATFSGSTLFTEDAGEASEINVSALARSSTWGKIFDFNNEGITENNYQAYTYDFYVNNNTRDEIREFSFKLTFGHAAYLASAWNGALEIHQNVDGKEIVDTVPDLRVFNPNDHTLDTVTVDGEPFVSMKAGDYLIYYPSTTANAKEMPIEAFEGTTPGIIMYIRIGENIENSILEIDYIFNRKMTRDPLFWVAVIGAAVWLIVLIVFSIMSVRLRQYQRRHQKDNEIINESIESFISFIDAKDPYTKGHSKRVAVYTRLLAKELGYTGEELDHIYYEALLHDCGKIAVPDSILGKPGKLTDEEFDIIKSHTVRGGEILKNFKSLENADEGAMYHHERYDGKGYPEGRKGEDIPFVARMICVADSFDAMNSDRVYRKRLMKARIIDEIEQNKGTQFDPKIADIMLNLIKTGVINIED